MSWRSAASTAVSASFGLCSAELPLDNRDKHPSRFENTDAVCQTRMRRSGKNEFAEPELFNPT